MRSISAVTFFDGVPHHLPLFGYPIFIPMYWIAVLHQPVQYAALMLTVYAASGAVATFFGGRIADRVGFKRIAVISIGSIGPLLVIFLLMDQVVLAAILLVVFALMHHLAIAPMVAMGQAYLPNRLGFASGVSMGVVVSIGGLAAPGLGAIGDIWGLQASMLTICLIAFVGLGVISLLFMGRNANDGIGEPTKKARKSSADF